MRIQSERGHHLITDGPYAWIHHPGFAGSILLLPCGGLALGSYWLLVPAIPVVFLIFRRTVIEDPYLHEHLRGYAAYAGRVRYRLLPGLW